MTHIVFSSNNVAAQERDLANINAREEWMNEPAVGTVTLPGGDTVPNFQSILQSIENAEAAAEAAEQTAEDSAAALAAAPGYASDANASKIAAAASASSAQSSATSAANSVTAAQAIVDSVGFRDVLFKTFSDSPITVNQAMSGKLLSIDTTGGNVVVNLPTIADLTLPFAVGVKKTTSDGNTVTTNRGGADLFDNGTTSMVFSSMAGASLIPDTDPSPDKWSVASFGAALGQQQKQQFIGGTDFTAGSTTTLTLTETPVSPSKDALTIYFDDKYQQESNWSYSPGTGVITFGAAITAGTTKVEALWATPLAIGTPGDGTVSALKLSADAVHGQTAKTAAVAADEVLIWDSVAAALKRITFTNFWAFLNGLTAKAVPVVGDYVAIYDTAGAAPKKSLLSDLFKAITGITADTNPDIAADSVVTYSVSAGSARKVLLKDLRALTVGTPVATTSGTSIDVTGIPSWAKRITIVLNGVSTNSTNDLSIQIGNGAFVTTGYLSNASCGTTSQTTVTGFALTAVVSSGSLATGHITLINIGSNTWVQSGVLGSNTNSMNVSGGSITLGGVLDRLRLRTLGDTNTFDGGTMTATWE